MSSSSISSSCESSADDRKTSSKRPTPADQFRRRPEDRPQKRSREDKKKRSHGKEKEKWVEARDPSPRADKRSREDKKRRVYDKERRLEAGDKSSGDSEDSTRTDRKKSKKKKTHGGRSGKRSISSGSSDSSERETESVLKTRIKSERDSSDQEANARSSKQTEERHRLHHGDHKKRQKKSEADEREMTKDQCSHSNDFQDITRCRKYDDRRDNRNASDERSNRRCEGERGDQGERERGTFEQLQSRDKHRHNGKDSSRVKTGDTNCVQSDHGREHHRRRYHQSPEERRSIRRDDSNTRNRRRNDHDRRDKHMDSDRFHGNRHATGPDRRYKRRDGSQECDGSDLRRCGEQRDDAVTSRRDRRRREPESRLESSRLHHEVHAGRWADDQSPSEVRIKSEPDDRHSNSESRRRARGGGGDRPHPARDRPHPARDRPHPAGHRPHPADAMRVAGDEAHAKMDTRRRAEQTSDGDGGALERHQPDFALSGKLAEDTNTFNGVVVKYSEPPEARQPKRRWRLYVFRGDTDLPTLYIHRQSGFLLGRDRKVADIPVDHPSCSKQHAVLQYRLTSYERPDGSMGRRVRPYIMDLESANGTFVNNKRIDARRYVELIERDVLKFGFSLREYVLLHEHSKDDEGTDEEM